MDEPEDIVMEEQPGQSLSQHGSSPMTPLVFTRKEPTDSSTTYRSCLSCVAMPASTGANPVLSRGTYLNFEHHRTSPSLDYGTAINQDPTIQLDARELPLSQRSTPEQDSEWNMSRAISSLSNATEVMESEVTAEEMSSARRKPRRDWDRLECAQSVLHFRPIQSTFPERTSPLHIQSPAVIVPPLHRPHIDNDETMEEEEPSEVHTLPHLQDFQAMKKMNHPTPAIPLIPRANHLKIENILSSTTSMSSSDSNNNNNNNNNSTNDEKTPANSSGNYEGHSKTFLEASKKPGVVYSYDGKSYKHPNHKESFFRTPVPMKDEHFSQVHCLPEKISSFPPGYAMEKCDHTSRIKALECYRAEYRCQITAKQEKELEDLRWAIQKENVKRYFTLEEQFSEWGSIEVRDGDAFFMPGSRKKYIHDEKKFLKAMYEKAVREGIANYATDRMKEFEYNEKLFMQEERKHRLLCSNQYHEKNSVFSSFPLLGNRFLFIKLLGKGGNGEVWEVIDYLNNKEHLALKICSSFSQAKREFAAHSAITHKNVVKVGDRIYNMVYCQNSYSTFTMEIADNDLQQIIDIYGCLDEESAVMVVEQLLEALCYLHDELKKAHYDLKPSNILVCENNTIKLTDFHLTRDADSICSSCDEGTMKYLPPECFNGAKDVSNNTAEKADMWMLGIIYYSLLFGKHPILGSKSTGDMIKLSYMKYTGTIHFPTTPSISSFSKNLISTCLNVNPECRLPASELYKALQDIQGKCSQ